MTSAALSNQPELLPSDEAAIFLRFDRKPNGQTRTPRETARLFREWAHRNRVPVLYRGRTLLYERRVLVAFLERRDWTKKHADTVARSSGGRKSKIIGSVGA